MNDASDTTDIDPNEADERTKWYAWWSSTAGTWVATFLVAGVAGLVLFGNLSTLGIWEPWEATEILSAREYAGRSLDEAATDLHQTGGGAEQRPVVKRSPNWATPTLDGRPEARSLLKTWLVSWSVGPAEADADFEVGHLERAARLPIAVVMFALVMLVFGWIKSHFDTWSALLVSVAFVTAPAVFLGIHTLSTEMLLVIFSSASIMAYFQLSQASDTSARWWWGAGLGAGLSLGFLDHRIFGLLSPLAVIIGYGVCQLPFEQAVRARSGEAEDAPLVGRLEIGMCLAALLGAGAVFLWGLVRSSGAPSGVYFLPHVVQWIAILVPAFILLAGLLLARNTRALGALISGPGAVAAALTAVTVIVVAVAYGQANPLRRIDGDIAGKIPVLTFLLDHHLNSSSLAQTHMDFALWIRQIGFSLLPWIALVPAGLGYVARSARLEDADGQPCGELLSAQSSLHRLLLVWGFLAAIVVVAASTFGHYYFPAYLPLVAAVGLMLADADFWKRARFDSLTVYAMGFLAVAIVMMLGKDLQRFPDRFVEAYLTMPKDLGLPDDFSFGPLLRVVEYGWALLLATFFYGLASWAGLTVRSITSWPARFREWRRRRSKSAQGDQPADDPTDHTEPSALRRRAAQKRRYRASGTPWAAVARLVELPSTAGALMAAAGVVTAGIFLFSFAPKLSSHLSQRGVFESYTNSADDGETLYRYNVSVDNHSVYLGEVPKLGHKRELFDRFDSDQRFFVVLPRKRLAGLNREIRKRFGRDLPVLDASSNQLVLASNKLEDAETQHNFIANAIVDEPADFQPDIPLQFAHDGDIVHPSFDHKIEFLGWTAERLPDDGGLPTYSWGEKAKLTFYFRATRHLRRQQKIFMHVDHSGSRLHGDHDPVGGDFPTNDWLPGDIIKDEYELNIDSYSSPGAYTIWMGFYRSGDRMKVTPRKAHDGQNRVRVGQIRVTGLL